MKVDRRSSPIATDENLYPKRFLDPIKVLGLVSRGDDFDRKPINFNRRCNPPPKVL
ncbi:MAG: hypothetical protein KME17_04420 [Cyanosarcina radialis HA8281-LM2]|nr:hypothetical protein [Cyanosarcina radialis HA8281-LM2]